MCEIYWETANMSSSSPSTFCGEQRSDPNFEKEEGGCQKKMSAQGDLKPWGLTVFFVKKDNTW